MRLIKPYGISKTDDKEVNRKRRLSPKPQYNEKKDVLAHLNNNPEATIALWISVIDKIATKPNGNKRPTKEQREFRQLLGVATWKYLENHLKNLDADKLASYKEKWERKIHPYEEKNWKPEKGKPTPKLEGRWYKAFTKCTNVKKIGETEANAIAKKIENHLYENALTIHSDSKPKRKGRISTMASAVENSVLRERKINNNAWCDETADKYLKLAGYDLAERISKNINGDNTKKPFPCAMGELYSVYGKTFVDDGGTVLSINEAKSKYPQLFALHMAIKETYKHLLEKSRARLDTKKQRLPENWKALLGLIKAKQNNQDINALIRLGRIIHYESDSDDVLQWIKNNHNQDSINKSRYWLSDYQAEIKRNEALVRIWRHTIALGAQTLADWSGIRNTDVLMEKEIKTYDEEKHQKKLNVLFYDEEKYQKKLNVLFGERSSIFNSNAKKNKTILEAFIKGWSDLRNASFHFKGIDTFVETFEKLEALGDNESSSLWKQDIEARGQKLAQIVEGAHFKDYATAEQAKNFFHLCLEAEPSRTPMPRFRRVLERADNVSEGSLPTPHNQNDYQKHPWLLCQYISLKLIYERAFPEWLEKRDGKQINKWITKVTDKSTKSAQKINNDELAIAKAAELTELKDSENINTFMDRLTATTATEMRVQQGYTSEPKQARKQAAYIDNLRCDVVALAFKEFLPEKELQWLLEEGTKQSNNYDLEDNLPTTQEDNSDCDQWMKSLYALIHLVPSEEINILYHQLKKFTVLANKASDKDNDKQYREKVTRLFKVLQLYLDMHNAQFVGSQPLLQGSRDSFKGFFESEELFDKAFPTQDDSTDTASSVDENNTVISYRGLREMQRFGNQSALDPIFSKNKIKREDWKQYLDDKTIEKAQERRKDLHDELSPMKKSDIKKAKGYEEYKKVWCQVKNHRILKNHIYLVNHVRLHRLLMRVLGRLIDYVGLFERDIYFVMLALFYKQDITEMSKDWFENNSEKRFKDGRIISAFYKLKEPTKKEINKRFNLGNNIEIRNRFAHFDILQSKNESENSNTKPNLTSEINKARKLMSYDRKLKNAVSKSIIEMLYREGLELKWNKTEKHELSNASVGTRIIKHFDQSDLKEEIHGKEYVAMVAAMFDAKIKQPDLERSNHHRNKNHGRNKKK